MTTERVERIKAEARVYLDKGDAASAVAVMLADMWPNGDPPRGIVMLGVAAARNIIDARRFVEGFR